MNIAHAGKAMLLAIPLVALGLLSARPALDMTTTASIAPPAAPEDSFRLVSTLGEGGDCRVSATRMEEGEKRLLRLSPGCAADVPTLSAAHYWLDRPDGTVVLSGDDGKAVATFMLADGAAYESYDPPYPVMTLIALD